MRGVLTYIVSIGMCRRIEYRFEVPNHYIGPGLTSKTLCMTHISEIYERKPPFTQD